jgi:predicted nucleic acid-binding protein
LKQAGAAHLVVPFPVLAEWWRGRSDTRDDMLGAVALVASVPAAKAAGIALARFAKVDAKLTIDAIVIATAALLDAVVVTRDREDFERLAKHFPGVTVLSV